MKNKITRRRFIGGLSTIGSMAALPSGMLSTPAKKASIVKPPRLRPGDTIGILAPASGAEDSSTIRSGIELFKSFGFRVATGKNIKKRNGYLAGNDDERVSDLHRMFKDDAINAVITLRGGYGSMRLLHLIDYELIRKHPKIFVGYSDITALNLAIHAVTGLVTFHGPVAISRFTAYTQEYFFKILSSTDTMGEIKPPDAEDKLRPSAHFNVIHGGTARGKLIGGNLTLLTAILGTPYDLDTTGRIVFIEEVGEEPYAIDRMLTQLLLAQKLQPAAGIIIDRCSKCGPREYKPAFSSTLSVEDVFEDRLNSLNIPILFGSSLGHIADKPTLPLGIEATLDADHQKLIIEEAAVS